ncbi:FAD-dependent oxidoreductase [Nonomuraea sp. NPDC004297]
MRVIVIGAGLGGLTLAQGLRQTGIDVTVYERDPAEGRPQGISLHVDERGKEALRACLPPGHFAMVEATMGGPREQALTLAEANGELAIAGHRILDGTAGAVRPGRQTHRPLLREILLTGLKDTVRFGTRFTQFKRQADGSVRALFADGGADTADVLVGADGIGSTVRDQHLPHVHVVDNGRRMLMGATPLRAVAGTGLPDLVRHSAANTVIRGQMMALGVLRFTQSPPVARDRWLPELRSRVIGEAEDYVMWALPVTPERLGSDRSPAALWRQARVLAAVLHPTLRFIVDEAWPDLTVALRGGAIPTMPPWPAGPVTVIGDAIHVAPGFGGNLAMQDAHRLRDALVLAAGGELDLSVAIGSYEDAMRRDNFRVPDTIRSGA